MSLRSKTILGIGFIELVLLSILLGTVIRYIGVYNQQNLETHANTTVNLFITTILNALIADDLAAIESAVQELLKNKEIVAVKIVNTQSIVLTEGGAVAEFKEVGLQAEGQSLSSSRHYLVTREVQAFAVDYGTVELLFDVSSYQFARQSVVRSGIGIALIELLLSALFSFMLGTYLTKQLSALKQGVREVAAGDLETNIPVSGNDELAELARTFNHMTASLKKSRQLADGYQQELQLLNQALEHKVTERTQDLTVANDSLMAALTELRQTKDKMVQTEKLASVGQLAAGVAHEINNPLAYIQCNLEAIKDYIGDYVQLAEVVETLLAAPDLAPTIKQQLEAVFGQLEFPESKQEMQDILKDSKHGLHRIGDIVSNLKLFARADDQKEITGDVNDSIRYALKIVDNSIKYKCKVELELGELPPITCQPSRLAQVFINLIMNAAQAMTESMGQILITTHVEAGWIQVAVQDNGSGMSADVQRKIFDPFYTTKDVGEGTGLGLAITHGIIEEHGGSIHLESKEGEGTTFTIKLPCNRPNRPD